MIEGLSISEPECPQCSSSKIWKDGLRKSSQKLIQRYICRNCGYRFSLGQTSNKSEASSKGRVCDIHEESKNLAVATEPRATGDISNTDKLLIEFIFYLKKRGNKDNTIERRIRYLKTLSKKGYNLTDPESIKQGLSEVKWVGKSKNNTADTYTLFLKMIGKTWEKPHYQEIRKIPFVPTESEIDQLITACGPKTSTFLQIMKETAMRPGETARVTWNDIDYVSKTIKVTPEKGSNPRIFPISDKLLGMIQNLHEMSYLKNEDRLFQRQLRHIRRNYQRSKIRLANKVQNPRLAKIMLKTFRTWKATMLYHQTKDPWYVMEFLGHTSLQHTRKYVILEKAIYHSHNDDFVCKVAKSSEEAVELIELGFEFVNEINGSYLYRKRK